MPNCHACASNNGRTVFVGSKGIMNHRAAHRRRKQDCTITLKTGTWIYHYSEED